MYYHLSVQFCSDYGLWSSRLGSDIRRMIFEHGQSGWSFYEIGNVLFSYRIYGISKAKNTLLWAVLCRNAKRCSVAIFYFCLCTGGFFGFRHKSTVASYLLIMPIAISFWNLKNCASRYKAMLFFKPIRAYRLKSPMITHRLVMIYAISSYFHLSRTAIKCALWFVRWIHYNVPSLNKTDW